MHRADWPRSNSTEKKKIEIPLEGVTAFGQRLHITLRVEYLPGSILRNGGNVRRILIEGQIIDARVMS